MNKMNAIRKHGFWIHPRLPPWAATTTALLGMKLSDYFKLIKPNTPAYHNLCTTMQPPKGTADLLWNGLKFCVEKPLPKPKLEETIERLTNDVRRQFFWNDTTTIDDDFNHKLYVKSSWSPPKASPTIEAALVAFKDKTTTLVQQNLQEQKRQHNLSRIPRNLLRTLPDNTDFIFPPADKNLGPCVLERSTYKVRCYTDHLSDTSTYRRLTQASALQKLHAATYQFHLLIERYKEQLPSNERTYFKRCFQEERRIPQFYCTPKVHKSPWKTRPIVSCVNSRMGDLSKWVDVQLQRVVHLCPGHLKDSKSLLRRLRKLGQLPDTAFLVTADAESMYTNIDTNHGLETLAKWFQLHHQELPQDYNVEMVLKATKLVMHNNVFQFDDTYWLQLTGTAMGTSLACMYATIYYSYHEETRILPVYAHQHVVPLMSMPALTRPAIQLRNPALLLHARLIDDAIQIWDAAKLPTAIVNDFKQHMRQELSFGILTWKVEKPSRSVDFLDLTINLETDGSLTTKTYVKEMNLHLYIPPASAHPKGVLKSLIFGTVLRYWEQNSKIADFKSAVSAFYGHLLNRKYTPHELTPIFQEAAASIAKRARKDTGDERWDLQPTSNSSSRLFIHWEYHPRGVGRRAIRQAFEECLAPALEAARLKPQQLTIAYSTPRNLGQLLNKTQLDEPDDIKVSTYIGPIETHQPTSD